MQALKFVFKKAGLATERDVADAATVAADESGMSEKHVERVAGTTWQDIRCPGIPVIPKLRLNPRPLLGSRESPCTTFICQSALCISKASRLPRW